MGFCSVCLWASVPSLEQLSIEEKVGQLLMVHFNGHEANEEARRLIEEAHVGGFIYYNWANGLDSPAQVRRLSEGLQRLAWGTSHGIPLFLAVDQEGGRVCRLVEGFTRFPGNGVIGRTCKPEFALAAALAVGRELMAVGVNVNLAPVVDINSNPDNPIIGDRSFGPTADDVIACGQAALEGYRQAAIIACLKHYPGYGDVSVDPHGPLPVVKKSIDELAGLELLPFQSLTGKADMVMTAHLMLPHVDRGNCATLSSAILERMLRRGMRYQGIVISDSLVMQGVLENCGGKVENAVVRAFLAGCDILLLGGKQLLSTQKGFELSTDDVIALHGHLVKAVKSGKISEARLNDSVDRILKLKGSHAAFATIYPEDGAMARWVGCPEHRALSEAIKGYQMESQVPAQEQIGH